MEQTLTIVCKIQPTPEQTSKIEATLQAFADACNYIHGEVPAKITGKASIQLDVDTWELLCPMMGLNQLRRNNG